MSQQGNPKYRERVYSIVRRIPRGRVMTYGQIAELLGEGYTARTVGFAMHSSPDGTPWHRVINAQGKLSLVRASSSAGLTQFMRLAREGIRADAAGRIPLAKYGWRVAATGSDRRIRRTADRPLTRTKGKR